jgi:hypothetical protein
VYAAPESSREPISLKKQNKELTNEELNINHASSIKKITYNKIDASFKEVQATSP